MKLSLILLLAGCANKPPSVYQVAYTNLTAFEIRSGFVYKTVWKRLKPSFKPTENKIEEMAELDLRGCIKKLEAAQENTSRTVQTKSKLLAEIEVIGCMHFQGWRPTVSDTMVITH